MESNDRNIHWISTDEFSPADLRLLIQTNSLNFFAGMQNGKDGYSGLDGYANILTPADTGGSKQPPVAPKTSRVLLTFTYSICYTAAADV